jgi:hypothetical protein
MTPIFEHGSTHYAGIARHPFKSRQRSNLWSNEQVQSILWQRIFEELAKQSSSYKPNPTKKKGTHNRLLMPKFSSVDGRIAFAKNHKLPGWTIEDEYWK